MSKNTYPLKLPTSVKKAAAELAAADGVSLNQFIAAAVAEKVGSLRAAEDLLRERAGTAKPKDMLEYLRRAPKVAYAQVVNAANGASNPMDFADAAIGAIALEHNYTQAASQGSTEKTSSHRRVGPVNLINPRK